MESIPITNRIFDYIENRFYKSHKDFLDNIGQVLHIQKSSVYKKVKGDSTLTIDEVFMLCQHYKLSMDEILGIQKDMIYFDFPALHRTIKGAEDFIVQINKDLERIATLSPTVYYATKELPYFYYFSSFPLAAFKFHVYYNMIWRNEKHAMIKFDLDQYQLNSSFVDVSSQNLALYCSVKSVEIWNYGILDNTLNQIRYFLESGFFVDPLQSLRLCNDMDSLVDTIAQMLHQKNKLAMKKTTESVGTLEVYNNEIAHTNNVIFVQSETIKAIYSTYDNPNFMRSFSPALCDYTEQWFARLKHNSAPLTHGTMKDQQNFINHLRTRITKTKISIEAYLKVNDH